MDKIKKWLPAVVVCLIIFGLSSIHGDTIKAAGYGHESYNIRAHLILYGALYVAFYKATKSYLLSFVMAFFYGVSDEFHQTFVPGRAWQSFDLIIDSLGAFISAFLLWSLKSHLPTKLKNWLEN